MWICRNLLGKTREIYSLYLCLQQLYEFCISRPCNDRKRKLCVWICRNLLDKANENTWSELIFGEFFCCAAASITSVAGAGSSKRNDERGHPMRVYSVNDHSSLRGEAIYRQCVHLEWVKHDKRGNIIKGVSVLKLRVSCCCDSWNLEKKSNSFFINESQQKQQAVYI